MKYEQLPGGVTRIFAVVSDPNEADDLAIVAWVKRVPRKPTRRVGVERGLPGRSK